MRNTNPSCTNSSVDDVQVSMLPCWKVLSTRSLLYCSHCGQGRLINLCMCSAVHTDVRLKQAVRLFYYQDTLHSNWLCAHPQLHISLGRHFMPTQLDHAGCCMLMHRLTSFTLALSPGPAQKSGKGAGVTCKDSCMCCVSSLRLE